MLFCLADSLITGFSHKNTSFNPAFTFLSPPIYGSIRSIAIDYLQTKTMDYLSLCLIVKDENAYLQEWIDYHILLGVERFYIYDNHSQVSVRETLSEDIARGWVVTTEIDGQNQQLAAYDHCLQTYGDGSYWMGFIDADEFLVPKQDTDLRQLLSRYESFGGLAANWVIFGSNGYQNQPAGGILASYTRRTPEGLMENRSVKSIVQPGRARVPKSPHHFIYQPGWFCVNELGNRVNGQHSPHSIETIQVNHYWSKSRDEFDRKQDRWRGFQGWDLNWERFNLYNELSENEDRNALELVQTHLKRLHTQGAGDIQTGPQQGEMDLPGDMRQAVSCLTPTQAAISRVGPRRVDERRAEVEAVYQIDAALQADSQANDLEKLEQDLLKAIQSFPDYTIFYCNLAEVSLSRNKPALAWSALAAAWKMAPQSYDILIQMGVYYQRQGNLEQAEKIYRLALDQDPCGYKSLGLLAGILVERGNIWESYQKVTEAVQSYPVCVRDPEMLGLIKRVAIDLYRHSWQSQACQLIESALAYNPQDIDLLVDLGKIHFDGARYAEAETCLRQAARLDPLAHEIQDGLRMVHKALSQSNQRAPNKPE